MFSPSNVLLAHTLVSPSVYTAPASDLNAAIFPPSYTGNSTTPVMITLYNGTVLTSTPVGPSSVSSQSVRARPSLTVEPMVGGSLYPSRPYEGGWQTGDHSTWGVATAVQAQITFPSTNPSSIPSGNWLEGTINLQGQDCCITGQDYMMRAAHVLYPDGHHGVVADMWEDCEGLGTGQQCGGFPGWAKELTAFILNIYGLSAGQTIYVKMVDSSNVIYWYYSYDGNSWMQYYSYTPPSTFKQVFYLGTVSPIIYGPYFTAYYYQFGFWTQSHWNCNSCFQVQIKNPSYYQSGAWHTVQTAESMQGPYTYFDQDWALSNTGFVGATANVPQSSPVVTFYEACGTCRGIADNTKLWG
ncbi:MAG TPA: hypothetical protein VFF30_11290 [Nitrososphaerales archaeon]|nr:hypothetical protein [Nitrososphaerales archaeon]